MKPKVILNEEQPEIIAEAIIKLSNAAQQLLNSGLNERALLVLLKDASGVPQREITRILAALPRLKTLYCKAKS